MATERMGRKKLLSKAGWVEVSVAPHGKRAALPRHTIEGVLESHVEGVGAFITYSVGNSVTNLPVLDLYLPLLHEVLENKKEPLTTVYTPYIWNDPDADPSMTLSIKTDTPEHDFPYPGQPLPIAPRGTLSTGNPIEGNGDDIKAPQNT